MNRPTSTLQILLVLAPLLLAGCADERAAIGPPPTTYPLAPYGVPLAQAPASPQQG
jgi:hypothetical protein